MTAQFVEGNRLPFRQTDSIVERPLDQLHTCERVNFENSSLADFKDLKQKLEYKLLKQTECILAKLHLDL